MRKGKWVKWGWLWLEAKSAVILVSLLGMLLIAAPTTLANGHSVKVFLRYTPGISNWGNFEASGLAGLNPGDGLVHLVVNQLPCDPHVQYQAWIVPVEQPTQMIALGYFDVDAAGHAEVDFSRSDLHTRKYRFLVITAEPVPDKDKEPDARRALAGTFPNSEASPLPEDSQAFADLLDQNASANGQGAVNPATGSVDGTDQTKQQEQGLSAPSTLPVTGAVVPNWSATEVVALAGGLLVITLASVIFRAHRLRGEERER